MAAYFIQYSYIAHNEYSYDDDCIINYEKFEKVDEKSFYRKFEEKIKQKHYCATAKIKHIIKL